MAQANVRPAPNCGSNAAKAGSDESPQTAVGCKENLEVAEHQTFNIYPTPTHGVLNIELPAQHGDQMTVSLVDMMGRKVKRIEPSGGFDQLVSIDLSGLPAGVYIIMIENNTDRYSRKVIVT
ncbi:MAG: hypothetical protein ACI81P_001687 [Neolewinella sp.]|jgi:hypothetical protein